MSARHGDFDNAIFCFKNALWKNKSQLVLADFLSIMFSCQTILISNIAATTAQKNLARTFYDEALHDVQKERGRTAETPQGQQPPSPTHASSTDSPPRSCMLTITFCTSHTKKMEQRVVGPFIPMGRRK